MTKDPADILELNNAATLEELERAYRKASRKYHPDAGGTKELFQELNAAYEELKKKFTTFDDELVNAMKNLIMNCPGDDIYETIMKKIRQDVLKLETTMCMFESKVTFTRNNLDKLIRKQDTVPFFEIFVERYQFDVDKAQAELRDHQKSLQIARELYKIFKLDQQTPESQYNAAKMATFYQMLDSINVRK